MKLHQCSQLEGNTLSSNQDSYSLMENKILSRCSEEATTGPVPNQTRPGDVLKYNTYKIRVNFSSLLQVLFRLFD